MLRALDEFEIEGIPTTIAAHRLLLALPEFIDGSYTTKTVEGDALEVLSAQAARAPSPSESGPSGVLLLHGSPVRLWHPAIAGSVSAASHRGAPARTEGAVIAPMHGTILKVLVARGDHVEAGDPVAVLEAMKMETQVSAPASGSVTDVKVEAGAIVESGQEIALIG
jgi:acetyl-CoA/propionyl-CoA carboxylase biotin carboxyl carrier protein